MKKLRVAFVGAGTIMRFHARVLAERDDVEMVAAADVVEGVLTGSADTFNIPGRYLDYQQMLADEDIDFTIVCVPNAFHKDATIAALEAGSHVLCEKPPAMNVAEAEAMAAAATKADKRLAYGLHMRYLGETETGRAFLEAGRLGEVYHASVQMFRRRGIPGLGSWFTTKAVAGGGALIDLGVHLLDRTHYLMGQPKPVAATGVTHARFGVDPTNYNYLSMWGVPVPGGPFDVDDLVAALIRFENGASLVLQVSWAANTIQGELMQVMGTKGGLYMGHDGVLKVITEDSGFNADLTPMFNKQDPRVAQLDDFIGCLRDPKRALRTDARQGIVLQKMLDAIYTSAQQGHEVSIN